MKQCTVIGCERVEKRLSRGWCTKHYGRWAFRGTDPNEPTMQDKRQAIIKGDIALIPIGMNAKYGYATVDLEDVWLNKYKWHLTKHTPIRQNWRVLAYAATDSTDSKNKITMHRLIMTPEDNKLRVDHINHDGLDNRRSNLRIVTSQQNSMNSRGSKKHSSIYKGVSWSKCAKKWDARIKVNYRSIYLGLFESELEAARAYNAASLIHHGEFGYLNNFSQKLDAWKPPIIPTSNQQ